MRTRVDRGTKEADALGDRVDGGKSVTQVWQLTPAIPELWSWRQEERSFKVILNYIAKWGKFGYVKLCVCVFVYLQACF